MTGDLAIGRSDPLPGRLHRAGGRLGVVSFPLSTALPIPLRVVAPEDCTLVTWAFAGLAPEDPGGPRALLVLASDGWDAWNDTESADLLLATHYRDLAIRLDRASPPGGLPAPDRVLVGQALLPATTHALPADREDWLGLTAEAADGLVPDGDAPEVAFAPGGCSLDGFEVPAFLWARAGSARVVARVARADVALGAGARVRLAFEGGAAALPARPEAALALFAHRVQPLRVRAA